jgi:hypothetical protein
MGTGQHPRSTARRIVAGRLRPTPSRLAHQECTERNLNVGCPSQVDHREWRGGPDGAASWFGGA